MSFLRRRMSYGGLKRLSYTLTAVSDGAVPTFPTGCFGPSKGYNSGVIGSLSPTAFKNGTITSLYGSDNYSENFNTQSCDYSASVLNLVIDNLGSSQPFAFEYIEIPTSTGTAKYYSKNAFSHSYFSNLNAWEFLFTFPTTISTGIASGTVSIYYK